MEGNWQEQALRDEDACILLAEKLYEGVQHEGLKKQRHHPQGRLARGGPYICPDSTILLTKSDHDRFHVVLRALEIEFPPEGMDLWEYRARRAQLHITLVEGMLDFEEEDDEWAV